MRFCSSAILASLTSSGACSMGAGGIALAGACGFLPPVSHIIRTISKAKLMSSQDWTFFGSRPGGLGAFSCTWFGWFMGRSLLRRTLPRERQLLLANGEVGAVEDLGNDVNAILELEIDQVWFPVLHFVQGGFFPSGALDIGEGVVVIDGGNQKRFARGLGIEQEVELEFCRVTGAETVDLLAGLDFCGVELVRRLRAQDLEFFLVRFRLAGADIAAQPAFCVDAGAFLRFNKDL